MVVGNSTIINDSLNFIKELINSGVTDPVSTKRDSKQKFVLNSYPGRHTLYPVITLVCENISAKRLGMNTEDMVFNLSFEIRVWGRSPQESDVLMDSVINVLRTKQKDADGTANELLYNLEITYVNNSYESGKDTPKSKILGIKHDFYT